MSAIAESHGLPPILKNGKKKKAKHKGKKVKKKTENLANI